jgi:hypothetical protein
MPRPSLALVAAALASLAAAQEPEPAPEPRPSGWLDAFQPRIAVIGDAAFTGVHGTLRDAAGADVGDRFSFRAAELDLRADIDAYAAGVLIVGFGEESPGEHAARIDEGYLSLHDAPRRFGGKAGRFRTQFGQANLLHGHDLPQTDRPLAVRTFLGEDGDMATGVGVSGLLPGLQAPALTLHYQLVNGENDAVLAGDDADHLAHVVHTAAVFDLPPASSLEVGASLLIGRASATAAGETVLLGADLLYRGRPAARTGESSLVLQAEGYHLQRRLATETIHSSGGYGMAMVQLGRATYLGARGDWTQFADADSGDAWAASGWASYHTSDFVRLRIGVEHLDDPRQDADWLFFLQGTFVIGSPPPQPYWVNR